MDKGLLCRLCLRLLNNNNYHNITTDLELVKKYLICTSLEVDPHDVYPKNICEVCYNKVHTFHEFKKMCFESLERFQVYLCEQEMKEQDSKDSKENVKLLQYEEVLIESSIVDHLTEQIDDSGAQPEVTAQSQHISTEGSLQVSVESSTCGNFEVKGKSRVLQCNICPKTFRKEARLHAHIRLHQGLKPYACFQCKKEFSYSHTMRTHIEQQHSLNRISHSCTYEGCNRVYTLEQNLLKHINDYHLNKLPVNSHICEVCGKTFQRKLFLNRHLLVHMDKSKLPFECDECGKRFSLKMNLRNHLHRHAGIKNFVCTYCGIRKTTKNELKSHMNYHTQEKTWICSNCGKVFYTAGNLKLHMRTVHHGVRDYKCRFCNMSFGKLETLKHHEMRHTGERPYKCLMCERTFIQAIALKKHMNVHKVVEDEEA